MKSVGDGSCGETMLAVYDCRQKKFTSLQEQSWPEVDSGRETLWQAMVTRGICTEETAEGMKQLFEKVASEGQPQARFGEFCLKNEAGEQNWYRIGVICTGEAERVAVTVTDLAGEVIPENRLQSMTRTDRLTGLLNSGAFGSVVEQTLEEDEDGRKNGAYSIVYLDIVKFKAINDIFGVAEGDRLLKYIAEVLRRFAGPDDAVCRQGSDRFILFAHTSGEALEMRIQEILATISEYDLPIAVSCSVGVYVTGQEQISANRMIDRATLAQSAIKGSYAVRYNFYDESLRKAMLSETEIVGSMENGLREEQFVVYYQPQYNHSTGMIVGAEALVRWRHPERGMISPGYFIPIFEKNGFITRLDLYVFEKVCNFLHGCMEEHIPLIPISINFSRYDIFQQNFVESIERIRQKYGVPVKYLRVEITESALMGGSRSTNRVVRELHRHGYVVEMDDFGSGYSSLNVLKDVELDIIKLDMLFMEDESGTKRGGTILTSVVRMAKWLGLPIIAEGVEKVSQADFLRSIGCDYIQGYLYSKPLPEESYRSLLDADAVGALVPQMNLIETLDAHNFWDPESLETLIFSNYVGGAAIFEYQDGQVEVLRVNKKYLQEICMNLSEKDMIRSDPMRFFDKENSAIYFDMLERAIQTGEEQECETWRNLVSSCCGEELVCLRSSVRMIGRSGNKYLFYAMIRNITAEKENYRQLQDSERRFKAASEQINIYYWEYTVATHEMRPCFRCMRDLGLPPLLTNYPDSAIERGIFPPETADMYRDWHRQIAEGVPKLEAIIPLTMDRVPFHVRYTTEFDENGRPIKAYGSAAQVV